jgi:hypothetical protein
LLPLVAVLIAQIAAGLAYPEQKMVPPGISAHGGWRQTEGRTPLASKPTSRSQAALDFLEEHSATGGNSQHG